MWINAHISFKWIAVNISLSHEFNTCRLEPKTVKLQLCQTKLTKGEVPHKQHRDSTVGGILINIYVVKLNLWLCKIIPMLTFSSIQEPNHINVYWYNVDTNFIVKCVYLFLVSAESDKTQRKTCLKSQEFSFYDRIYTCIIKTEFNNDYSCCLLLNCIR